MPSKYRVVVRCPFPGLTVCALAFLTVLVACHRQTAGTALERDTDASARASDAGPQDGADGDLGSDASSEQDIDASSGDAGPPPSLCPTRTDRPSAWRSLHGGEPLGARVLADGKVEFSLFAPGAREVHVMGSFNGFSQDANALERDADGLWSTTLAIERPQGQEYRFVVDGRIVADPYARANRGNEGNSILVGKSAYAWHDRSFVRKPREQLVIYETHVGDFSRDPSSGVPEGERGKFAGFARKIEHLTRLGVNAVELMPIMENQSDGYDWGYSASLFFAPDANFASDAGGAQIDELKALIDALHGAGIAVIVDVVYNHVSGQTGKNHFWGADPVYYFDVDGDGDPENDRNDWGYAMATDKPFVRKLMFDNMKMLLDEYHVDGFRLDATSHMSIDAVLDVVRMLHDAGYCDRTFIAEEFDGVHNERIRAFNLEMGSTVISSWGTGYKNRVWDALRWPDSSMTDLTRVTYYSANDGWQRSDEVVNYVSSHDEGTLHGWLGASKPQVEVAITHLLTSAGLPMLWLGDEFMRVQLSNHGEGATDEQNNRVDWSLAQAHADLVDYTGALVRLRIAHPSLYGVLSGPADARFRWDNESPERAIAYVRHVPGDHAFFVLANYQTHEQAFELAFPVQGAWHLMADGRRAASELPGLATLQVNGESTRVVVPGSSAHLYMSNEPF